MRISHHVEKAFGIGSQLCQLCLCEQCNSTEPPQGSVPKEFLDLLSDKHAQKVAWVLRLVEKLDRVPEQYLKKLVGTEDRWEIRAQAGGKSYRLLGFFDGPSLLILTGGFSKKQQKTPRREIELAQQRRNDYFERSKKS